MQKVYINDQEHVLVVALVHTKTENGAPALIKLFYDDEVIELNGGEEFCTLWLNKDCLSGK